MAGKEGTARQCSTNVLTGIPWRRLREEPHEFVEIFALINAKECLRLLKTPTVSHISLSGCDIGETDDAFAADPRNTITLIQFPACNSVT